MDRTWGSHMAVLNEWVDGWMGGCMYVGMDEWMNEWMDG